MDPKVILLFNHKGGVSKTTTTYNVGWMLASRGKKVLLVDADPQCNLTGLILGDNFDSYYTGESTKKYNIKDAVQVAFDGKPTPITKIPCVHHPQNSNLLLIPGHMDLSEYDPSLSLSLNSNNAISTLQNLPGAFFELIRLCSEENEIDYVMIDLNPGLNSINQTFFMMADAFIVPTNPDPFSLMALRTLNAVLPRWKKWATQARETFKEAAYPLPNKDMKFLGEIIQRFNIRKQKPASPYTSIIEEIKQYVENEFSETLKKNEMIFDITKMKNDGVVSDYCLAEISEFGSLLQKAHESNVPVIALSDAQISESGVVLEQMIENRNRFSRLIEKVAHIIAETVK